MSKIFKKNNGLKVGASWTFHVCGPYMINTDMIMEELSYKEPVAIIKHDRKLYAMVHPSIYWKMIMIEDGFEFENFLFEHSPKTTLANFIEESSRGSSITRVTHSEALSIIDLCKRVKLAPVDEGMRPQKKRVTVRKIQL